MSVPIARLGNAFSVQKKKILMVFPSPQKKSASFVRERSFQIYKQTKTGQFTNEEVILT